MQAISSFVSGIKKNWEIRQRKLENKRRKEREQRDREWKETVQGFFDAYIQLGQATRETDEANWKDNVERTGCDHTYKCTGVRPVRDREEYRVSFLCTKCGKTDIDTIYPVSAHPAERRGDPKCEHNMVYDFELPRSPSGVKVFTRCTKCSRFKWDIVYP